MDESHYLSGKQVLIHITPFVRLSAKRFDKGVVNKRLVKQLQPISSVRLSTPQNITKRPCNWCLECIHYFIPSCNRRLTIISVTFNSVAGSNNQKPIREDNESLEWTETVYISISLIALHLKSTERSQVLPAT